MSERLPTGSYLSFPFRMKSDGGATSGRAAHVREQIEQVLFTDPGERVFRPEFGAGVRRLVFEPNSTALWEVVRKRLQASLNVALQGEVDPKTLEIEVSADEDNPERLLIEVSYVLATIRHRESHNFTLEDAS